MRPSKRQLQVLLMIMAMMLMYTSWYTYATINSNTSKEHDGIIRFHVIANSNSEEDQALKLEVRDKVLQTINGQLIRETMIRHEDSDMEAMLTIDESRQYILDNLTEIQTIAEEVIAENGFDYPAQANLGRCWIPEKKYGDITYPAGNYEALNISIGEGAGENWWCVLFPPLCLIDTQKSSEGAISMDGVNLAEGPNMEAPEGVRLKFKTIEIIDSIKKD